MDAMDAIGCAMTYAYIQGGSEAMCWYSSLSVCMRGHDSASQMVQRGRGAHGWGHGEAQLSQLEQHVLPVRQNATPDSDRTH